MNEQVYASVLNLSPSDMTSLRLRLEDMDYRNCSVVARLDDDVEISLYRLSDSNYIQRANFSKCLTNYDVGLSPFFLWLQEKNSLSLPQFFLVLSFLFGESGGYDDYKGSFSFNFHLEIQRQYQRYSFYLRVRDWRGSIEYELRRHFDHLSGVGRESAPVLNHIEFTEAEFMRFMSYFVGFLEGRWQEMTEVDKKTFVHAVQSNFLIYGYDGSQCFEEKYCSEGLWSDALKKWRSKIHEIRRG